MSKAAFVYSSNLKRFVVEATRLGKLRLATSVVFSSAAGYMLGYKTFSWSHFLMLIIGGGAIVAASNAFNQIYEKDRDALMNRTKGRPLPSGLLSVKEAWIISILSLLVGLYVLYRINLMTLAFGALSVLIYTSIYTPMKAHSPLAVFIGAIPGALPYMLGWVAARNDFDIETGTLFAQQFFWQFPHFWAIAWFSFDDYKRAGYHLLPTGRKDRASKLHIIIYTVWMMITGILPAFGITGELHLSPVGALLVLILAARVLQSGIALFKDDSDRTARKLMMASIVYLTGMQVIYVIDRFL